MKFFEGLYTLQDIAIHHNFTSKELKIITKYSNSKNIKAILELCPRLRKFLPYCKSYTKNGKNVYAIPARVYDLYTDTGLLIDINLYDSEADIEKLNYWEYNPNINLNVDLTSGWEFAKNVFKDEKLQDEDIFKIFLAGCARMDYYQQESVSIDQRVKYAIVEYMLKRPQFFTTDDFIDNPVLHKKYKK